MRGDDQGDHHLYPVATLVPAVAEGALVRKQRIALEIGGCQVVEQHIEARLEQRLPACLEKREKGTPRFLLDGMLGAGVSHAQQAPVSLPEVSLIDTDVILGYEEIDTDVYP